MKTYHIQENYSVQASNPLAAREGVLAHSSAAQPQKNYSLHVSADDKGDYLLCTTIKDHYERDGKMMYELRDSHWHFTSYEKAEMDYMDALQDDDLFSASIVQVLKSTDYGL
tara:strand:+ start:294 stop:629 length:336 start_codon:yes stop_codon:yes gene_type:complete